MRRSKEPNNIGLLVKPYLAHTLLLSSHFSLSSGQKDTVIKTEMSHPTLLRDKVLGRFYITYYPRDTLRPRQKNETNLSSKDIDCNET
ncbi:hypothetical protein AB205_0215370 [Aquarana catesbeiana]|uniref:Uncharacterized protein n=1 Tax=Aquarana catesbeiana TaxID=8400 RepID=A0A2G9RTW8_AQUCT|nr:hypothetical protein AB205_0215370 [Aquarana catesbeiana]